MGARLLTSAEVRETLRVFHGAKVDEMSEDDLVAIAQRMRMASTVIREELAERRAHAAAS